MALKPKRHIPRFLYSWPMLILLALVCIGLGIGVVNLLPKVSQTKKNLTVAQDHLNTLTQQEQSLQKKISALETSSGKEASIRTKYHLAKEGEGVVVITDSIEKETQEESTNTDSFFSFFTNLFTN